MKKFFFIATLLLVMLATSSCGGDSKDVKWEYKVVRTDAFRDAGYKEDFAAKYLVVSEDQINELGAQGWELVNAFTEVETAHPNYGNEKYVTGLQANVRSAAVTLIFKRPKLDGASDKKTNEKDSDTTSTTGV